MRLFEEGGGCRLGQRGDRPPSAELCLWPREEGTYRLGLVSSDGRRGPYEISVGTIEEPCSDTLTY